MMNPAHTSPAHTSPAHTSSAFMTPAHTSPAHTSPAHTSPAHTSPAHTSPAHTSSAPAGGAPDQQAQIDEINQQVYNSSLSDLSQIVTDFSNTSFTDFTWKVKNLSNNASGFLVKMIGNEVENLPPYVQLLVYRTSRKPLGYFCTTFDGVLDYEFLVNVILPIGPDLPTWDNLRAALATFSASPEDELYVTLRMVAPGVPAGTPALSPQLLAAKVISQAVGDNGFDISRTLTSTQVSADLTSPSSYGTDVTFTAEVTDVENPTGAVTEGTVQFYLDGTAFGAAVSLNGSGQASKTIDLGGAGGHLVAVSYLGTADGKYGSSSGSLPHQINAIDQTIVWNNPAAIDYGTLLSATQLDALVTVLQGDTEGALTYDPPAGTKLAAGTHTLTVTAAAIGSYNATVATVDITVNAIDQTIVWNTPAAIDYGTPLSATQLDALVTVLQGDTAGALTYDPPAGTKLAVGTHTLTVTAAAIGSYNATVATVDITVNLLQLGMTLSVEVCSPSDPSDCSEDTPVEIGSTIKVTAIVDGDLTGSTSSVLVQLNAVYFCEAVLESQSDTQTVYTCTQTIDAQGEDQLVFAALIADNFSSTNQLSLTVGYEFNGFLSPLGPANDPATEYNQKIGGVMPLKWQLFDNDGSEITKTDTFADGGTLRAICLSSNGGCDPGYEILIKDWNETPGKTEFKYDRKRDWFQFNWDTQNGSDIPTGLYEVQLVLYNPSGPVYKILVELTP
jgi:hypothetical protein